MQAATDPQFSIIVLVQQEARILDLFFSSLASTISQPSQVVVVEDGLKPSSSRVVDDFLIAAAPRMEVIHLRNDRPLGYAVSANSALARATGEFIVMVDSDVILLPGWQQAFLDALLAHPNAGAIGAKLLYPQSGGIQHCGLAFSQDIVRHLWLNAAADSAGEQVFSAQAVVFALCCMRREAVRKCGPVDESYFNGYEDLDYCFRLRQLGFDVLVAPAVTAYHWERSSGIHRESNRRRNLGRFWRQWGQHVQIDLWPRMADKLRACEATSRPAIVVDLCEDRVEAVALRETVTAALGATVEALWDMSYGCEAGRDIWLPQILGPDGYREPCRFVFAVQNIVQLTANHYWWQLRSSKRTDDLAIDLYGNVEKLEKLVASAWPGHKIR